MIEQTLPEINSFIQSRENNQRLYSPETISPEMIRIAEKVAELTGTWNPVEIFTPSPESLKSQKTNFLSASDRGEQFEPTFDYDVAQKMDMQSPREQLATLLHEARSTKPQSEQERLFRVALVSKIKDDLATCDLVDGIKSGDEKQIRNGIRQKFPEADPVLVAYAEHAYRELITPSTDSNVEPSEVLLTPEQQELLKKTSFNADQIKAAFEWMLEKYGILKNETQGKGFKVTISNRTTGIDVRDKSEEPMTIFIPQDRVVTGDKLLELMAHEIEGHARQSMNGVEMFLIGGGPLKMDGEVLYEGLAKRLDESFRKRFFGTKSGMPVPWYTLAVNRAFEGAPFSEIFKDQFERQMHVLLKVPADQELNIDSTKHAQQIEKAQASAWNTTYRVMRGHVDMSNPQEFAMSKDLAYLKGWLMDTQLRQAGLGGINEMGVIQSGGLQLIARLGVDDSDIPYPYQDLVKEYCFDVLLPKLTTE